MAGARQTLTVPKVGDQLNNQRLAVVVSNDHGVDSCVVDLLTYRGIIIPGLIICVSVIPSSAFPAARTRTLTPCWPPSKSSCQMQVARIQRRTLLDVVLIRSLLILYNMSVIFLFLIQTADSFVRCCDWLQFVASTKRRSRRRPITTRNQTDLQVGYSNTVASDMMNSSPGRTAPWVIRHISRHN